MHVRMVGFSAFLWVLFLSYPLDELSFPRKTSVGGRGARVVLEQRVSPRASSVGAVKGKALEEGAPSGGENRAQARGGDRQRRWGGTRLIKILSVEAFCLFVKRRPQA